jgi:regulator of sigma E protease
VFLSIIIGIFIFGLIVLVHEFGHFIVARFNGIFVEEFAIGMGPKLVSVNKNNTMYSIRLLPIGGYCKMLEEDEEGKEAMSFNSKKVSQRISVVLAGAIMNFILAIVIFIAIALTTGYRTTTIGNFTENSPAQMAGLQVGDQIVRINGSRVNIFEDLSMAINNSHGRPIEVTYRRNGVTNTTVIQPVADTSGNIRIGIMPKQLQGINGSAPGIENIGFFEAISAGYYQLLFWTRLTIGGIIDLFTFNIGIEQMAGPIGVVSFIGVIYEETSANRMDFIINMFNFAALLSVSVGAFNLMPIPALDGGRLVFLTIEAIRKKPISEEVEGKVHLVGFIVLMGLAVVVAYQDILRLF